MTRNRTQPPPRDLRDCQSGIRSRDRVDRHCKVGLPRCPPGERGIRDLLASYGDAGISPRDEEGKINLLTHYIDVIYAHAHTVTQTVGLSRMLPDQAKTFRVIVKIIRQPADVHQTLDEEVVEFDEQPKLGHTRNHPVVLLAQLVQHELDFFDVFSLAFSVIGEPLARGGGGGNLWETKTPKLAPCRRHASGRSTVTQ